MTSTPSPAPLGQTAGADLDARLSSYSKTALAAVVLTSLAGTDAAAQTITNITSLTYSGGTADLPGGFSFQIEGQAQNVTLTPVTPSALNAAAQGYWFSLGPRVAAGDIMGPAEVWIGDVLTSAGAVFHPEVGLMDSAGTLPFHASPGAPRTQTAYLPFWLNNPGYFSNFGWLRFRAKFDESGALTYFRAIPMTGTSDVYGAYASWSNITVGSYDTASATTVPEPATVATGLGLLALGAAGVREFRRRRQSEAA